MASQELILNALLVLVGDKSPFTRRYASTALFTLACVAENAMPLVYHQDGKILTALSQVLSEDSVEEARINAAEALFNLVRNSGKIEEGEEEEGRSMIEAIGNHSKVIPALAQAVLTDYSADVRAYSARYVAGKVFFFFFSPAFGFIVLPPPY